LTTTNDPAISGGTLSGVEKKRKRSEKLQFGSEREGWLFERLAVG
jgi:hypothetical protein